MGYDSKRTRLRYDAEVPLSSATVDNHYSVASVRWFQSCFTHVRVTTHMLSKLTRTHLYPNFSARASKASEGSSLLI